MRTTVKIIGNGLELPSGKVIRLNDIVVCDGDSSMIRGDILIMYYKHGKSMSEHGKCFHECEICKADRLPTPSTPSLSHSVRE